MFSFSSIAAFHSALQQKQTDCAEAVRYYLQKISENQNLNAFIEIYEDEALQRAIGLDKERQEGKPLGALHGVVIALKDVICYEGHRVTAASGILRDFISPYSATAVRKLMDAGAIIIGNCNCDEFAMGSSNENSVYGPTLNPIDNTRVPGGSSGGSAAAVAAGLCMVALGSDTGGSVRQPADFCGIVGYKPSYGTVSRYGLIAYASSFDQIGIFARGVDDVERVLNIIGGADEFDSTATGISKDSTKSPPYSFGFFSEALDHPSLDLEIRDAYLDYFDELRQRGHQVEALNFPFIDYIVPAYYILTTAEASSNLSRYDGVRYGQRMPGHSDDLTSFYKQNRSKGFGREVKRRVMLGTFVLSTGYYEAYFSRAQKVRKKLIEYNNLIFNEHDYLIMPNSPSIAFKLGEKTADPVSMYLADLYSVYANLTGIPAITLPVFSHSHKIPFGFQLMSSGTDEVSLLRVSKELYG